MTISRKVIYGANQGSRVSTGLTASGIAFTGSGLFHGILIKCDGSNDVTVNVYDALSATGTQLIPDDSVFDGTIRLAAVSWAPGIWFDTGVYIEITTAGDAEIMLLYNQN